MTELEKKAYAYVTDRQKDPNYPTYNWETEICDAYEQGYKDAIDRACEWLKKSTILADTTIERFKKAMEEQQ